MSTASRTAGVALISLAALGMGGAAYQEIVCAGKVAYHKFVKYAQTPEGRQEIMANMHKLRNSPNVTPRQISNLENALSSVAATTVVSVGWACLPSTALGNETADDIFDEYLIGERSI